MKKKYRKKPIEVLAWRFGRNASLKSFPDWLSEAFAENAFRCYYNHRGKIDRIVIDTLEGKMEARPGDYLIQGVKGELYPCQADIFKMTYEEVE